MARILLPILALAAGAAAAQAAPRLIVARGHWASFDRGGYFEAVARSIRIATARQEQPRVAIAFDRAGPRIGQLTARLRRPARAGSSVLATIGDQPFLLSARGLDAWSRGPAQEAAILAAMRIAGGMRVEARDMAGRRMVDRYWLDGAPTAIDAAAAACSRSR
jgi:hypothetical protein